MRLETGIIQCGDDWPGVFIRGDNAFSLANALRRVVSAVPSDVDNYTKITVAQVESLLRLLERSNVHADGHAVDQSVKL